MVGFIGAGRMAQALAKGFITSGLVKANNITASDTNPICLQMLKDMGAKTTTHNTDVVNNSNMVIIATKPHIVKKVLNEVSHKVTKDNLFVSIAAGITIDTLEENLPKGTRVVRVMPNTPALVSAGASVVTPGHAANPTDSKMVGELLKSIGIVEEGVETYLDAVTGLSGSGPAYAFVAIEAMSDGGVKMGLPRDLATKLAAQTLLGAAKMVLETGKHPGQLKDEVCSPGGTTIDAIYSLEKAGFRGALIDAVTIATEKAKLLGAKK
ncbi:hypothetical protein LOTGIDRAFT_169622 [Lottia gigantea]|uniref:Pyrroline-5-carboxylate reductase n=1 Tax=Lottia gigantea TaxID=225164 RepID=V3ZGC9_LOTGI|nr:hypothetical protein LOTGIDRAFT_169622 [Lottia gigantea]ESO83212.1 hypothetical protein LOTGIDRAFT_169622 [Lottia gigantea]